jgi:hypothetical protein
MTADEEMRAAYGIDKDNECRDCKKRDGSYCKLTNKHRKCTDYGYTCGRFEKSDKYRFVVK